MSELGFACRCGDVTCDPYRHTKSRWLDGATLNPFEQALIGTHAARYDGMFAAVWREEQASLAAWLFRRSAREVEEQATLERDSREVWQAYAAEEVPVGQHLQGRRAVTT